MNFRPCIDIHNGKVKQLIGGSLKDKGNRAEENYVSSKDSSYYARLYAKDELKGGHIILLNSAASDYYEETKKQAVNALGTYPQGFQIGGGITDKNAREYLEYGASHVIVTSFVFRNGKIDYDNLKKIYNIVGKDKLVLDLSCRKMEGNYRIATDRWQNMTEVVVNYELLNKLSEYCDEFLIHAVDVEGKVSGIEKELVQYLGQWKGIPMTYAGGIASFLDIEKLKSMGRGQLDFTVGSALDIFGGQLSYDDVVKYCRDSY